MVNKRHPPKDAITNKTMDSINTQRVEKLLKKTEGRRISVVPANAPDGPEDAPTPGDIKNVKQLQHWAVNEPEEYLEWLNKFRLKAELIPLRGELEAKDERIAQLDELLMLAEQQVQQSCEATPLSSASLTTKRSAKFPDPPVFTGEITDGKDMSPKFEPWVLHVHDKLQMNQDHFKTDAAKTAYVFTRLSGDAMDHINSYCAGDPNYFKTSDSVLNALREIYDNCNRRENARISFRELRQDTKTPFPQFFSEFIQLARYLQFPEIVLIEDLKEKVLRRMQKVLSESSEDFNTLIKLKDCLIRLDNQQRNYFALRQKANTETEATKKTPISKTGSQFKPKVNTTLVREVNTIKSTELPALNSAKFVDKAVITESPKYSILKRQKAPSEKKSLSVPGSTTPLLPDKTFNDTVDIAIIGAAAFNRLNTRRQYQDGVQLFSMTIQEMEKALSEQTADNTSEVNISVLSMEEVLAKVPMPYQDLKDAFDPVKAKQLPAHQSYDHEIKIEGDRTKLPQSRVYPISNYKLQKLKEYLDENLKKGFISPSHAPYTSPVLFAVKLNGSLRVCVDYRKLNAITKRNRYPIPLIEETLAKVTGCKYLTKLDVIAAFNKLRMHPNSEDYTTFITSMGAYKYHVLPFGLTNSPANYQHYMNDVLWDHLNNFCSTYLDDILIYSKTLKERTQHVRAVLQKLIDAGLQVDIEKCKFHVQETSFLGVLLSTDGLRMDSKKVQVVVDWSTPTNLKQVQAFIGFCNFYRWFIKGFSKIIGPMLKLTQKGVIFQWTDTFLQHFDRTRKAILETDSSDHVNAGVLSQYDDDKVLHPVAFYSKNMVPAECNYEIYDKELLAIICCLEHWRPELEATELPVEIFTDHKALEHFMTSKELTRRQVRWAEKLSEYNFKIMYQTGAKNIKADALTQFADNNAVSAGTSMTPFFANKGFHPRMTFGPDDTNYKTAREQIQAAKAEDITGTMENILELMKKNAAKSQETMKRHADKHQKEITYEKIEDKMLGPFPIVKKVGTSYELELPQTMKVHNVFHSNLLRKDPGDPLPGQIQEPPGPIVTADDEKTRDLEWYYADGREFDNSQDIVKDFHDRYP
ncbi:retrotransposon nucleocapsid protein [Lasallia pustulata]|uniref:Retrotransposon nucleocapsid protein n=1 Tax=Lasallia pustulata TaxID=136370 RepID=A0A1W5CUU1_9LECA|nr:retrotransposon nucleocapsid protein [Lasallia pustulata]